MWCRKLCNTGPARRERPRIVVRLVLYLRVSDLLTSLASVLTFCALQWLPRYQLGHRWCASCQPAVAESGRSKTAVAPVGGLALVLGPSEEGIGVYVWRGPHSSTLESSMLHTGTVSTFHCLLHDFRASCRISGTIRHSWCKRASVSASVVFYILLSSNGRLGILHTWLACSSQ